MAQIELDEQRYRELMKQVQRAEVGDDKALRKLERISPEAFEHLLEVYGDLGRQVENELISVVYSQTFSRFEEGNQLAAEGLRRRLDSMREELYACHPSPLERLLVDRLLCNWIAVNHAERVVTDAPYHLMGDDDRYARWLERCQRRFLMAAKDLATVSRTLGPMVQVNIADRQVNVFGNKG